MFERSRNRSIRRKAPLSPPRIIIPANRALKSLTGHAIVFKLRMMSRDNIDVMTESPTVLIHLYFESLLLRVLTCRLCSESGHTSDIHKQMVKKL